MLLLASFIEDVSGLPNRQAELDLQAFPNRVWEREIILISINYIEHQRGF
jgi:hypothetical protein